MTDPFERYAAAVAALDQLPETIQAGKLEALSVFERAQESAAQTRRSAAPRASETRVRVQRLLEDAQNMLSTIGQADQLPRKLRPAGRPAELAEAESCLRALATAVMDVQTHREASRQRRLDEARQRERAAEAETDARHRAELARARDAERQRRVAAIRRARTASAVVAGITICLGLVLALVSPIAIAVALVLGTSAAWLTYKRLLHTHEDA